MLSTLNVLFYFNQNLFHYKDTLSQSINILPKISENDVIVFDQLDLEL